MMLSDANDAVIFVDPHDVVTQSLALALRTAFPKVVTTDILSDDNVLRIELRSTLDST